MNKRKDNLILSISLVVSLSLPQQELEAYATNTHANLHKNIASEYQRLTETHIQSNQLTSFLVGAIQEDSMIYARPLNHFYDPINNKGLDDRVPGVEPSSIQWATDSIMQGTFTNRGHGSAWIQSGKIRLFEFENDYSWKRAIYEYAHGDKDRGMRALGHVMHLLEDLTSSHIQEMTLMVG